MSDATQAGTAGRPRGFPRRGIVTRAVLLAVMASAAALFAGAARADDDAPAGVLVFGGTGQLGAEIVRELAAAGQRVTVFVRPTSDRARLAGLAVAYVEGDVLQDADVGRALRAVRPAVVVDALGRSGADESFFEAAATSIAHWSAATGVRQLIHHGSVGSGDSRVAYPPAMYAPRARLFRYKEAAERAVRGSGVPYTIIRNAVLRELAPGQPDRARLVEDPRDFGVVSRRGLARLTRECLGADACLDRTFHAHDPGMTY